MAERIVEERRLYNAAVGNMTDAFAFVMEYVDRAGPNPAVEITPCFDEADGSFQHYHVVIEGQVNTHRTESHDTI